MLQYLLFHSLRAKIETHDLRTVSKVKFHSISNGGAIFSIASMNCNLRMVLYIQKSVHDENIDLP